MGTIPGLIWTSGMFHKIYPISLCPLYKMKVFAAFLSSDTQDNYTLSIRVNLCLCFIPCNCLLTPKSAWLRTLKDQWVEAQGGCYGRKNGEGLLLTERYRLYQIGSQQDSKHSIWVLWNEKNGKTGKSPGEELTHIEHHLLHRQGLPALLWLLWGLL